MQQFVGPSYDFVIVYSSRCTFSKMETNSAFGISTWTIRWKKWENWLFKKNSGKGNIIMWQKECCYHENVCALYILMIQNLQKQSDAHKNLRLMLYGLLSDDGSLLSQKV